MVSFALVFRMKFWKHLLCPHAFVHLTFFLLSTVLHMCSIQSCCGARQLYVVGVLSNYLKLSRQLNSIVCRWGASVCGSRSEVAQSFYCLRYDLDNRGISASIPRIFQNPQTDFGFEPAAYSLGTVGSFLEGKVAGVWSWLLVIQYGD